MEAIGCLVPELWSKKHRGHGTQLFEKMQCFYVSTINFNVSVYYRGYVKSTRVLVKKLESWQRQMGKTTVIKAGAYIMSIDRKTTVYRLEACESRFLKNMYQMSIATRSRILLTCLSLYRRYSSRAGLHNSV